jgi:Tannase and feruloyl esterase.
MKISKKSWTTVSAFATSCVFMFNGSSAVASTNPKDSIVIDTSSSTNPKDFKVYDESSNFTIPAEIPASKIGLPTSGATISSATIVKSDEKGNLNGEYCKVLGAIHPVDKNAPDINFQVNLPVKWNSKILQYGGGGFDGALVTADSGYYGQMVSDPTPLAQGYVTFGSDSGHVNSSYWDSKWALNDEALNNFASDQLKKTKDTVLEIVQAFYKSKPSQVYFVGGSNGGREALKVVQRFPTEYNGVICYFPVLNWVPKAITDSRNADAVQANNGAGWISPEQYKLVNQTIIGIDDGLDGVKDGIISNIYGAEKEKDEVLKALKNILSDAQIKTLETFASPMKFNYPLANGLTTMPGYPVFKGAPLADMYLNQFGTAPTARDGLMAESGDAVIKNMIVRDDNFNPKNFDADKWRDKVVQASELLDATNPDISVFKNNGGKLILIHGAGDQIVTFQGTIDYYNQLIDKFGKDSLGEFVKFYMVPGNGHYNSEIWNMGSDTLGALDQWAVNNKSPENLIVTDQSEKTKGRTRPLLEYPAYPEYKGSGDVNSAENFSRATP